MDDKLSETGTFFLYKGADGKSAINASFFNETVWLSQKQMAELFEVEVPAISKHIKSIYDEGELAENATVSKMESVVNRGFRGAVEDTVLHYSLDMVIAVGYRVNSKKATEFRIWATKVLHEYIQKGFALDDERLKLAHSFDKSYFRELRERIKEIRVSERMLYQQLKDIYALSADYNYDLRQNLLFFANVQNMVHFAITNQTSAEIIYSRSDATKDNMNLTNWKGYPGGQITKQDIIWAKNYLSEPELKELKYIVNMFLDFAEHKVEAEEPIFMREWKQELGRFLEYNNKAVLSDNGSISRGAALRKASEEYAKYRENIKVNEKKNSEIEHRADIKELEKIVEQLK